MRYLFASLFIFAFGCEKSEDNAIAMAQQCLNTSEESSVQDCIDLVDNINSQKASVIRCSGLFIAQGFGSGSKFADAFEAMQGSGSTSPTTAMMPFFTFQEVNGVPASTLASQALEECTNTGLDGMALFSSFARIATTISALTGVDGSGSATDWDTAIGGMSGADDSTLGASAKVMADSYCSEGKSTSDAEFCEDINRVTSTTSDDATVGACLREAMSCEEKPECPGSRCQFSACATSSGC